MALILHVGSFTRNSEIDVLETGVFASFISNYTTENPAASSLISVLIIFFSAVMINRLVILNRLSIKISLFPGALYVVLVSLLPVWKGLSILTMCSLVVIFLLTNISYSGNRYKVEDKIFNIGFFCGFLILIYPPTIVFILLGIIGMSLLRPYKQREYLNFLNGILLPHFFALVYFYWNDSLDLYFTKTFSEGFGFWNIPKYSLRDMIFSSLWALALIVSLVGYPKFTAKKEIQARKKIDIMYWSMLMCLFVVIISPVWDIQLWFLAAPVIAFLISERLIVMNNELAADIIYTMLFIVAMVLQFVPIPA